MGALLPEPPVTSVPSQHVAREPHRFHRRPRRHAWPIRSRAHRCHCDAASVGSRNQSNLFSRLRPPPDVGFLCASALICLSSRQRGPLCLPRPPKWSCNYRDKSAGPLPGAGLPRTETPAAAYRTVLLGYDPSWERWLLAGALPAAADFLERSIILVVPSRLLAQPMRLRAGRPIIWQKRLSGRSSQRTMPAPAVSRGD